MRPRWSPCWVGLWVTNVVVLLPLAFLIPFRYWSAAAVLLFLVPELIALVHDHDALPPLTQVTRRYVPRWMTFILIRGLLYAAVAAWLGCSLRVVLALGGCGALGGWAEDHFDVTYDRPAE